MRLQWRSRARLPLAPLRPSEHCPRPDGEILRFPSVLRPPSRNGESTPRKASWLAATPFPNPPAGRSAYFPCRRLARSTLADPCTWWSTTPLGQQHPSSVMVKAVRPHASAQGWPAPTARPLEGCTDRKDGCGRPAANHCLLFDRQREQDRKCASPDFDRCARTVTTIKPTDAHAPASRNAARCGRYRSLELKPSPHHRQHGAPSHKAARLRYLAQHLLLDKGPCALDAFFCCFCPGVLRPYLLPFLVTSGTYNRLGGRQNRADSITRNTKR